jgi:hypothetical protein
VFQALEPGVSAIGTKCFSLWNQRFQLLERKLKLLLKTVNTVACSVGGQSNIQCRIKVVSVQDTVQDKSPQTFINKGEVQDRQDKNYLFRHMQI